MPDIDRQEKPNCVSESIIEVVSGLGASDYPESIGFSGLTVQLEWPSANPN
jgi:hypothetical protein